MEIIGGILSGIGSAVGQYFSGREQAKGMEKAATITATGNALVTAQELGIFRDVLIAAGVGFCTYAALKGLASI